MILVFGGTTEGKKVAEFLDAANLPYTYATKTKIDFSGAGNYVHGAMEAKDMEQFCKQHRVTHIVNAAHPFAENLHATVINAAVAIPKIRFERIFLERTKHPLVTYVESFKEALQNFKENEYKSLLGLSGVQTIEKLTPFWKVHKAWFRILDRDVSRVVAHKAAFPEDNLLYGFPQEVAEEIALFKAHAPEVICTKESGVNGKLQQKIDAAIATNIPIIIISKPLLSKKYLCVNEFKALTALLNE
jgi:precorrin-6x reductase